MTGTSIKPNKARYLSVPDLSGLAVTQILEICGGECLAAEDKVHNEVTGFFDALENSGVTATGLEKFAFLQYDICHDKISFRFVLYV
jgi:hypothetical protein